MGKIQVLVDTEFLQKLSANGKNVSAFKKVLSELSFQPVVHPYVAECELDMFPYFQELVREGYIAIISYNDFLSDETDLKLYSDYFKDLHDQLRRHLEAMDRHKKLEIFNLPKGQTVFSFRKAGMSLGDVHMVLLASFARIPVILSDDSDMLVLKSIAEKKFSYSGYYLTVLNCVEVLASIAGQKETNFTRVELLNILKEAGENKRRNVIREAWDAAHYAEESKK